MKLTRQTKFGLWAAAAAVIAVAAYFVGSALKPAEHPYYIFDTEAVAYGQPPPIAATSKGGFTGFGETDGSPSRVVISGRVVELTESSLTLESTLGQHTSIRFGDTPRVSRLVPGSSELLQPGVTVALRLDETGETAEAVLVLSQPSE